MESIWRKSSNDSLMIRKPRYKINKTATDNSKSIQYQFSSETTLNKINWNLIYVYRATREFTFMLHRGAYIWVKVISGTNKLVISLTQSATLWTKRAVSTLHEPFFSTRYGPEDCFTNQIKESRSKKKINETSKACIFRAKNILRKKTVKDSLMAMQTID